MNKHFKIICAQFAFLAVVLTGVYFLYPRVEISVNENRVKMSSVNANVVMISASSDFSNARYLELNSSDNVSFNLAPGTYYYKAGNGFILGFERRLLIEGNNISSKEGNSESQNQGGAKFVNVFVNVTKNGGVISGKVVLEPENDSGGEE